MSESKKKAGVWVGFISLTGVIVTLLVLMFNGAGSWGSQAKTVINLEEACKVYNVKLGQHDTAIAELRTSQQFIKEGLASQNDKLDEILRRMPRQGNP